MNIITDKQLKVDLFPANEGFHFHHKGNDYVLSSYEKLHEFFQKQLFDTVQFCHEGKKSYVHFGMGDVEVFDSKKSLRKALSREYGGAWIEEREDKRRYFVDESGWFQRAFREISMEEFSQKLETPSTWQKVLGIGLGILALAPGAIEFARHIPKEAGLGLLALQQKSPLLGTVGYSCFPSTADAQAMGTEFQVNTYTTSNQQFPSIAPLNDGGFVVSWHSDGQDGDLEGIYGQRYNAIGTRAGAEFQVNTYTTSDQKNPSVAPLNDGGFVISWQSGNTTGTGQDGDLFGIYGQRYNVNGAQAGTEFQVNTYTTSSQQIPSVAPLSDGGFVISWISNDQDGHFYGIYGQRYNATGARIGAEFQVNTYTTSEQQWPSIASLNDGGFVVSWESDGQDRDRRGIYGQRYNVTGERAGTEFQVNTYTTNNQKHPSVAPLNDGGFVVTWMSDGQDGDLEGIYGQRYNAIGTRAGAEFQVNTYTTHLQRYPSVAPLNDGGFIVTWESFGQDGSGSSIFGQRYNASGAQAGTEFQVNTYTTNNQQLPSVASLNDGGFVITWQSLDQDGDSWGIFGQRYDSNGTPVGLTLQTSASGIAALSSNLNQSQEYTSSPGSMRTLPGTPATSSTNSRPIPSGHIIYSVIDIIYEESYPIYVNGEIVGTFTISGGSGLLDSNNPNVITMQFSPSFAPEEEDEFIPLFSIPPGEATNWQSIQLEDTDFECLEAHTEINPSTSGDTEFGLIFTGADSCAAAESQIIASILPVILN